MQKRTRALRRSNAKKFKLKVQHYHLFRWRLSQGETLSKKEIGIISKSPKNCGCWMCSNPRAIFGLTFREIRQRERVDIHTEIEDFFKD